MIPVKAIEFKAIAIAIVATLSLDLLLSVALTSVFMGPGAAGSMTDSQIDALLSNQRFLMWSLFLGTISTTIGGFLAARFSRSVPYFHALIYGIFGLIFSLLTSDGLPLWYNAIGYAVLLPAALVGGHIAKRSTPRL
ncbi:MAG: hypothetical protein ACJ8OJ_01810 [Povalibacter sp.]